LELFRLLGEWDFYTGWAGKLYYPWSIFYTQNPIGIFVSYSIPLIAFASLLKIKPRCKATADILYFALMAVVGIFIAKGAHPPFGEYWSWLYNNIGLFRIFRDSYKFASIISLSYAVLIGSTTKQFYSPKIKIKKIHNKSNLQKAFVLGFIGLLITINAIPFYSGLLFKGRELPQVTLGIYNAVKFINANYTTSDIFRVFELDQGSGGDLPLTFALSKYPSIGLGWNPINPLRQSLADGNLTESIELLRSYAVKYVIISPLETAAYSAINFTNYKPGGVSDWYIGSIIGYIKPRYSEPYTFYITSDDGVQVWFNNSLVVNAWHIQSPTTYKWSTDVLIGDKWYPIVIYHYQGGGGEKLLLEWESRNQTREIVPSDCLRVSGFWVKALGSSTFIDTWLQVVNGHDITLIYIGNNTIIYEINSYTPYLYSLGNTINLKYNRISPVEYEVSINADQPFTLVLTESYHPYWIARISYQDFFEQLSLIPKTTFEHINYEGYNAWYINKTGTYTIILEFWPQKLFYIGSIMSITTIILCVLYIGKDKIKDISMHLQIIITQVK
jgi:hypothetical protein